VKSQLTMVGVSFISAIVGALVVSWLSAGKTDKPAPAPLAASSSPQPVQVRVLAAANDPQLAARLNAVEQQLAGRHEPTEAAGEDPPMDAAQMEAVMLEHRQAREASFDAEPVDRSWAADTARSFQGELDAFEGTTFRAGSVDCRTKVCRASLTWNSYEAALAESKALVTHSYATNCTKELLTPEPEGAPGSPYSANLYFDCGNLRKSN
jgi:hypothetical protein